MSTKRKLKVGDTVRVRIGVGEVDGVIRRVSGAAGHRFVFVRTPILDCSGETLDTTEFTVPEDSLMSDAQQGR